MNKCKTCRFFDKQEGYPGGHCRRQPPGNLMDRDGDPSAFWPYVSVDDWCGEHRALVSIPKVTQ